MTAAQAEYQARQERIQTLMQQLEISLEDHRNKAAGQPQNWGYPGDLGRVESGLQELVEFFQN